eukprot:TRINITY_DN6907_c0_g2_i6.p1 TRINITY_DN6907_c0_g2~~TRINITY_DN6907_c0_g2_i6.p1  ORF type:complete len:753 (+),score=231.26 TRINITY_DN6907_c0_g2_i6:55-2259(+)
MAGFLSMIESALEGLDESAEKIAEKVRDKDGRPRPAAAVEDDEEDRQLEWARVNLERRKRGEPPLPPLTPTANPAPPQSAPEEPTAPKGDCEIDTASLSRPESPSRPHDTASRSSSLHPDTGRTPSPVVAAPAALPVLPSLPPPPTLPPPPVMPAEAPEADAPAEDTEVQPPQSFQAAPPAEQAATDDEPPPPSSATPEEVPATAASRNVSPAVVATAPSVVPEVVPADGAQQRLELLEEEIALINREKAALNKRIRKMEALREEAADRTHEQIKTLTAAKETVEDELRKSSRESSRTLRDMQAKYDEAVEGMKQKDEYIKELQAGKEEWYERKSKETKRLQELQSQNDSLAAAGEVHADEITELQQKISALESDLAELHREIDAKDDDIRAGHSMIQMKESVNRSISLELEQYKARVAKIVVERDQEVAELTDRLQNASAMQDTFLPERSFGGQSGVESAAYEEASARAERLQNELASLQQEKRMVETEAESAEVKYRQELTELNSILEHYKTTAEQLQMSLQQAQQQSVDMQQAMVRQKGDFEKDLRGKDLQVQQVEKKLLKRESDESTSEINMRCQRLGEALLEKQAALETRNAELEQARLRLNTALQQIREMEVLTTSKPAAHRLSRHNDIEAQDHYEPTPYRVHNSRFFQRLTHHSALGRNVAHTAAQIDNVALQAGRFMRRNALLRVGLVLYALLLHLYFFIFMGIAAPDHPIDTHPLVDTGDGSGNH